MKTSFYYLNKNNEKVIARKSEKELKHAIIYTRADGTEGVLCCSGNLKTIINKSDYYTKGYYRKQAGLSINMIYSDQFYDPKTLRIVDLIK